jgi:hypothetical protein
MTARLHHLFKLFDVTRAVFIFIKGKNKFYAKCDKTSSVHREFINFE